MSSRSTDRDRGRVAAGAARLTALVALGLGLAHALAMAQSLESAQQAALGESWSLRSDRARQDGVEARLRGAVDAFLPSVQVLVERRLESKINYTPDIPRGIEFPETTPRRQPHQYGVSLDLPLFDGFQRWNTLQAARSQVEAGRQLSLDARQQVLLDTATAYLGVIRDGRIVDHRESQLASVTRILKSVQAQFSFNDATRTDIALAESRLQEARTALEQARVEERATRLEFSRLTGLASGRFAAPRLPQGMPRSEAEIAEIVREANPRLNAARHEAQAASQTAEAAKGALLPQVSLQLSHQRQDDITATLKRATDTTAKIQARIPIYQPGTIPRINESQALAQQRWFEFEDSASQLVTSARVGFQRWVSAKAQVTMIEARLVALRATVRGYEIERSAGFRTLVDELNGRGELAQAEVALATAQAERDRQGFALAALLNRLDPAAVRPAATVVPAPLQVSAPPPAPRRPARDARVGWSTRPSL